MKALHFIAILFASNLSYASVCDNFYEPDYKLVSGKLFQEIPDTVKPEKGERFVDAQFGTCISRLTNYQSESNASFLRNDYARRQAFNADNTKAIVYASNGYWHLYDIANAEHKNVLNGFQADAEPQWHPTNPNLIYFIPNLGIGMELRLLDIQANQYIQVSDFYAQLPWQNANAVWTRSEGSPSRDARYWAFHVDDSNWNGLGVIVWDLQNNTLLSHLDYAENDMSKPDHVSMSPSGDYVVVSSDQPGIGTRAYTRDFKSFVQLHHKSEHSDLALLGNGHDAYVSIDYQDHSGRVFFVDIQKNEKTYLFETYEGGSSTALHISGKAYDSPGWVLISTYNSSEASQWFHKKLLAVELRAAPTIYNLAHTYTTSTNYWTEPHASVNKNFTRLLFNSNFGVAPFERVDAYMLELPSQVLVSLPPEQAPEDPEQSAPEITMISGTGWHPYGTKEVELIIQTNIESECRFSFSGGYPYGALYLIFSSADSLTHRFKLNTYSAGDRHHFVRCKGYDNEVANEEDFGMMLRVATSPDETNPQ